MQLARQKTKLPVDENWNRLLSDYYNLRPIKTKRDHKVAIEALKAIMSDTFDRKPTVEEKDYLDLLGGLIEQYEKQFKLPTEIVDGVDCLIFLAEENDMSQSDIGRLLGDRTLGHKIMTRKRKLTLENIKILADRFCVNPGLFLR